MGPGLRGGPGGGGQEAQTAGEGAGANSDVRGRPPEDETPRRKQAVAAVGAPASWWRTPLRCSATPLSGSRLSSLSTTPIAACQTPQHCALETLGIVC